jgi:hypothetical protein
VEYICSKCNYKGLRKKVIGGSNLVSIMLWVVVPISYTLWQLKSLGSAVMNDPVSLIKKPGGFSFGYMDIVLTALGPIYSIWRRIKKTYACPLCGEKKMIPVLRGMDKILAEAELDVLSPESLKKIPFRWAKDIEEYKEKHAESGEDKAPVIHNPNTTDMSEAATQEKQGKNELISRDNMQNNGKSEW